MTVNQLIEILLQYPGHIEVRKEQGLILHEIKAEEVIIYDYGEHQTLAI